MGCRKPLREISFVSISRIRREAPRVREDAEIDIWYDRVDVDDLIGYLAPYDADELGSWIERKARRRTSRGASTKLTQVVDGRRTIIEDPPFRTHLQAVGDTDPEAIMAAYRDRYQTLCGAS